MGWKDWPAWIKGGVIGIIVLEIVLFLISFFIIKIISPQNNYLYGSLTTIYTISFPPNIFLILFFVLIGFLIGAIIGWIVGKIRNR
ncbi:MAG: hypothetical protein Q7S56_02015 [Nanoarchaeota archaeon]|nr:hypothetical protein [Nanoarchaeota archaeon]